MWKMIAISASFIIAWQALCTPSLAPAASKEVAVIWDTRSTMVNDVVTGFTERMKETAPELKVTLHAELRDFEEAKRVFQRCEKEAAGIVLLRSSGAEYLSTIQPKTPCFVGACNCPKQLGIIKNPAAPEGMITGVTYFVPFEERFRAIKNLFPNVKSLAFIAEKDHPSTALERLGTMEQCKKTGIEYKEALATDSYDLINAIKNLNADLFVISNTRLAMDNVTNILAVANPKRIPIFSYAERPVKVGATAGLFADDAKLGRMLADSVVDVVVRGKAVKEVPVKTDNEPRLVVNQAMAQSVGAKGY
jgi:putative ABC transport system substrate-binding protein